VGPPQTSAWVGPPQTSATLALPPFPTSATAEPPPPFPTSVIAAPPPPFPPGGFDQIGVEESKLLTANAYWRKPDTLIVDKSDEIGLGIQSAPLSSQINQQLDEMPGSTQPAGQIRVSPHATATLVAASGDAEVAPVGSQDNSTPANVDLAWKWSVTPKRPTSDLLWQPTDDLVLTAYVVVHLEGSPNDVVTTTKTLHIPVRRTWPYTFGEIATSWKTWAGIIGIPSVAGAIGWFHKRTKQGNGPATD
jgi:hypothetical protein